METSDIALDHQVARPTPHKFARPKSLAQDQDRFLHLRFYVQVYTYCLEKEIDFFNKGFCQSLRFF